MQVGLHQNVLSCSEFKHYAASASLLPELHRLDAERRCGYAYPTAGFLVCVGQMRGCAVSLRSQ